jgi:hypothetical protein
MSLILGILDSGGAAASASSYESIQSFTAVGGETTITLSSIPSTYKHLQLRYISKDSYTASDGVQAGGIRFNGDTGSNYASHRLRGTGVSIAAAGSASSTVIDIGSLINVYGNLPNNYAVGIIDIIDYASTTKYKTIRAFSGADVNASNTGRCLISSGLWMSTAAITSITFNQWIQDCAAGSTYALYGIKG